jgi:hypothetical protein
MPSGLEVRVSDDGTKSYYKDGQLHRRGGEPAHEGADGSKAWWVNGVLHRVDGPAVIHADGTVEWWLEGIEMDEEEVLGAEDRMTAPWEDGVTSAGPVEKITF